MERLRNGIYATAMNKHILNLYEDMEDEQMAEYILNYWLMNGVPDRNELEDNIDDYGEEDAYDELLHSYLALCREYRLVPDFSKEVEEISKNIVEMLDNPYYNVI